jgi:hypothetical protein
MEFCWKIIDNMELKEAEKTNSGNSSPVWLSEF